MALTVDIVDKHVLGDLQLIEVDVTPDNSYAIGGEAFTKAELGLDGTGHSIVVVFDAVARKVNAGATADNAVFARYDSANGLLQFFWDDEGGANSALVEVDGTTDLSAFSARVKVLVK
ncbi:MAG TPA: hypothetical protein VFT50_09360 [Baekduia sp.]|nr:hypothetical protein [Baekduia sp.]